MSVSSFIFFVADHGNSEANSNRLLFDLKHDVPCGNFQIVITTAVRICKQHLQLLQLLEASPLDSAGGDSVPQIPGGTVSPSENPWCRDWSLEPPGKTI